MVEDCRKWCTALHCTVQCHDIGLTEQKQAHSLFYFLFIFSLLHRCSHIILDEIHERDILSDFLIIIIRDLLTKRSVTTNFYLVKGWLNPGVPQKLVSTPEKVW